MRCYRGTLLGLMAGGMLAALLSAQQPPAPKAPALPPINPAAARADVILHGLDGPATAIVANEDLGLIAAACESGTIRCWTPDMVLGLRSAEATPLVLEGHHGSILAMAWQGDFLVSAGADQKLIVRHMPDGKVLHSIGLETMVRALALSPDGKILATGSDQGAIQLWDTASGEPGTKLEGHTDWVTCLAFSADGKQLASGGLDAMVRLWDVAAEKKKLEIAATPPPQPKNPPPTANRVYAVAFSPDGSQVSFGGTDAQIHLASTADGKVLRSMTGHTSTITALEFHPSGTVLISGSKDRTVRLWNPGNGQLIKALEGHQAWVQGIVLVGRGTRIASAGADHTVRIWNLTEPPKK